MAPAGHIVPPARGGAASPALGLDFPLFWPLTCRAPLWHNVARRPRRGILGFLSPRFSSPVAAGAFLSVFSAGGKRFSFAFSAPPKGERRKTKQNAASALGFRVVFCFVFPWQNKTTSASSRSAEVVFLFVFLRRKTKLPVVVPATLRLRKMHELSRLHPPRLVGKPAA